eukprot:CAMPEP_0194762004 /NCGR_PEP_ID=MMETSP0323_2-20130528/14597_1 /TAXON_ID=2866 ORGANISM="Crypthecodinium cohnii, Strain Seligo" /NCGR_SAMPLE_ID=MMETSP0323_2 /ASSEMBLY_ACC=CAM_ASM_000346 /LENGTH=227 /DNA_ID=CAMNT_0039683991 /DNA_START=117 /DNA_END=800 /DNA_ORIENTATION=-
MQRAKNKKTEIAQIRRDLQGERTISLTRLTGDTGTDDGERRSQLIWQNFKILEPTKATAVVLGSDHPDYAEGKDAAAANSAALFETELIPAGPAGVPLERLSTIHSHYFGSGFEKAVGKKLRQFVTEKFEYDEATKRAKAPPKLLNVLRKREARELINEELDHSFSVKRQMVEKPKREMVKPPVFAPSQMVFDPDMRPRYATTKMQPDELEERGGGFDGKGGGKGLF